jgi:hypothetical protein
MLVQEQLAYFYQRGSQAAAKEIVGPKKYRSPEKKDCETLPKTDLPNFKWNYQVALELKQSDRMKLSSCILNPLFMETNT